MELMMNGCTTKPQSMFGSSSQSRPKAQEASRSSAERHRKAFTALGRSSPRRRNARSAIWRSSRSRPERFGRFFGSVQSSPEPRSGFWRSSPRPPQGCFRSWAELQESRGAIRPGLAERKNSLEPSPKFELSFQRRPNASSAGWRRSKRQRARWGPGWRSVKN